MIKTICNERELKAVNFASKRHSGQYYSDDYPYFVHLYQVVSVAKYFNLSEDVIAACWLHDVIEDTATSYNDLAFIFGSNVADIVYDVTDELGKNRKERHTKTYKKVAANPEAIKVKLCDRIANLSFGLMTLNERKIHMYIKENEEFKSIVMKYDYGDEKLKEVFNYYNSLIEELSLTDWSRYS